MSTHLDLIGTKEIARMLGVTQAHCTGRIIKRPDFPKPTVDLSQKLRKWQKQDVTDWILGKKKRP